MKKVCLLSLAALFCVTVLAAPATAVTAGFDAEQLTTLKAMGLETPSWMLPTPQIRPTPSPHPDFPLTCSNYNNSWCTYAYDGGCCCVAIYTAPGAACGSICV